MTTFDERKKSFENKFKHDQELKFKAEARRNKLLGLWAAELMGLEGADAQAYAKEVIAADFEAPGDDDVLQKVYTDLRAREIEKSEHQVRRQMDDLLIKAQEQILQEVKD